MTLPPTPAERLDRAVDALLAGDPIAFDPRLGRLVEVADLVRAALVAPPVSARFEARLAERLADLGLLRRGVRALGHPNRLLVVGAAVSSAAVGVGVTAYAVWRSSRRHGLAGRIHR